MQFRINDTNDKNYFIFKKMSMTGNKKGPSFPGAKTVSSTVSVEVSKGVFLTSLTTFYARSIQEPCP